MASSKSPLVSIMMPTYNAEAFVAEAIESVLSQNYRNIELLISDDASTDKTQEIIRYYELLDQRVLATYNEKNKGIAKNCNSILMRLRGSFVCLFAGDDIMLASKISTQIAYMLQNPNIVMSYHNVEVFDSDTNQTIFITRPLIPSANVVTIIEQMGIPGPMSIMVRTAALPKYFYNESYPYICDWLFQIEIANRGDVGFIDQILCKYRKYGVNNGKKLDAYEHEFIKVLSFVKHRYPHLSRACEIGEARYLAGFAFRQRDLPNFRAEMNKAILSDPKLKYRFTLFLSYLPCFVFLIKSMRRLYKSFSN